MTRVIIAVSFIAFCIAPALSQAKKIAVAKGSYTIVWDEKTSDNKAQLVADTVVKALQKDGHEVVLINKECQTQDCLVTVCQQEDTDDAVFVQVDENPGQYQFSMSWGNGKNDSALSVGALSKALENMSSMAVQTANNPQIIPKKTLASDKLNTKEDPTKHQMDLKIASDTQAFDSPNTSSKKLSPVIFWTGVALTGVFTGTAIGIEVGTNSRIDQIKTKQQNSSYIDTTQNLQKLSIAFSCVAIAFGTATLVSAFFTNFKKDKNITILPAPIQNGGFMMMQGNF